MNKKLILHYIIFNGIGTLIFIAAYILTMFNIIDAYDKVTNGIILIISSIISIVYYIIIIGYDSFNKQDCIALVVIYFVYYIPLLILAFQFAGVQMSVFAVFAGGALSITANNICILLQRIDNENEINNKKYNAIISKVTFWRRGIFIGMFVYAATNIFFPLVDYMF